MSKKINIVMIIETSGPGGGEQVFLDIAKNIDRDRFNPSVILFKKGWLYDQLNLHNIMATIISSKRSWDLLLLFKIIIYCYKQKIDLIHSHFMGSNLYAGLAGMILRIPTVATFHNELILSWWSYRFSRLKHFLIRNLSSKIVIVAKFMKKDYEEIAKFPRSKLTTIYNGIELNYDNDNTDSSSLKKELDILDDDLLVGHIANLRAPKGHQYLIKAASIVCSIVPNARFLLVGDEGDGTIKKEVEDSIAELGLKENVRLLGFRKDVNRLLKLIDVFVLSSISEGLPLSVIEAMASSKPAVVTNVGGLQEIVVSGETGYLVEAKNAEALAEKLILLLKDKTLRVRMGQVGKKAVEEKYSLKTMIDNYQNLYEELLK